MPRWRSLAPTTRSSRCNEELIAAENELKAGEEKYCSLVENINEVIY